ncbi:8-amino-7-oxononanoate synthase [Arcticibacter svalbardensis MN12-7]|uniref:8-amino-7-oxononanoate synthase n=1 Tax=Arcticibacter svalbardensis MN12-7 TaxID=1150600 RepID=R9GV03_9SPHI|nr:8-amino-7-oxononanoate synthase [Arcticibacter svalbardensis]EOR95652.1 8-amino-7-oxononanoate synthase [Arcticibacter svalbardensis MN12-7]
MGRGKEVNNITTFLEQKLEFRKHANAFRKLTINEGLIDFCSNDYLGFASSADLRELISSKEKAQAPQPTGSTGSRLISGNNTIAEQLETDLALFHSAESALLFNSGYDANIGLFSSLAQRGDTIITDELAHASIIDGARLSNGTRYSFRHNDLKSLEAKIKVSKGNIYIAVESIYSMDGDEAPLKALVELAEQYGAALIVDEAHATGIYGPHGSGLITHYDLEKRIFARVITFGKALGCHGAAVVGSSLLRNYLINFARSFIYSTAAPSHSHLSVSMAYQLLQKEDFQTKIHEKIQFFKKESAAIAKRFIPSNSPIQSFLIPGNNEAKQMALLLKEHRFDIRPILSPTVQEGKERLRICLHTFNSVQDIKQLLSLLIKTA